MTGAGEPGVERVFTDEGIVELLNGWHMATVGTAYALAAHTHKLGFAVWELHQAGFTIEVIPLVRAACEAAFTAS